MFLVRNRKADIHFNIETQTVLSEKMNSVKYISTNWIYLGGEYKITVKMLEVFN